MNLYLAPMEEVTGYVFRNTMDEYYGGVDKYFTPFISPNQNKIMKTRDGRELMPEHNHGKMVVPQILTNDSVHFLELMELVVSLGYKEVNLNFGCPSATVIKKKRGSGILNDTTKLRELLKEIFEGIKIYDDFSISVKTRIGMHDKEDLPEIMDIYNSFPISELVIHPRLGKDFYKGVPDMDAFDYCYKVSKCPVVYNGDINTKEDYERIIKKYPDLNGVMIGRGAVAHPQIFSEIKGLGKPVKVKEFQKELFATYVRDFGENDAVSKMKEFWTYYKANFSEIDREYRELLKAKNPAEYKAAVISLLYKGKMNEDENNRI